jgi:DNA modification methylase
MGSGTTCIVAQKMGRETIGIEILPEYFEMVKNCFKPQPSTLPFTWDIERKTHSDLKITKIR